MRPLTLAATISICACNLVPAGSGDVPYEPLDATCADIAAGTACGTGAQADVLYTCKDGATSGEGVRCAATQVCRGAPGAGECITNPCAILGGGDGKVCGAGKYESTLYTCTNGAPDLAEEKTCGDQEACRLANGAGTGLCTTNPCAGIASGQSCGFGGNANTLYTCESAVVTGNPQQCGAKYACKAGETPDSALCDLLPDFEALPRVSDAFMVSIAKYRGKLYVASNGGHIFTLEGNEWVRDASFETALGTDCCTGANQLVAITDGTTDLHFYAAGPAGRVMHLAPDGTWTRYSTGSTQGAGTAVGSYFQGKVSLNIAGGGGYAAANDNGDPFVFSVRSLSVDGNPVTANLFAYSGATGTSIYVGGAHFAIHANPGVGWIRDAVDVPAEQATFDIEDAMIINNNVGVAVDGGGNVLEATLDPTTPATWHVTKTFPFRLRSVAKNSGGMKVWVAGSTGFAAYRDGSTWYELKTAFKGDFKRIRMIDGVPYLVGGGSAFGGGMVMRYVSR